MGDTDKLKIRNMGVVDIKDLNNRGMAESTSFTMAEVLMRNPSWGRPEPRPAAEYAVSPNIELSKITDILEEFSMSRRGNRSKKSLRNSIRDYVFKLESTKNIFCIHRRSSPEHFYDRTVLRIPGAYSFKQQINCPRVLIVSDSEVDAKRVEQALIKEQRKFFVNVRSKPGVHRLNNISVEGIGTHNERVMVGSIDSISEFLDEARNNNRIRDVKEFLKFIVFNNAEKLCINPKLNDLLEEMSEIFENSWTRYIFMYHFAAVRAAPVLNVVRLCHEKLVHEMFIEVQTPRVRNLFERVEFSLAVSSSEFADRKAAQEVASDRTLSQKHMDVLSKLFTAQAQKLVICAHRIGKLRLERERRNSHLPESKKRRERILIVTKSSETAIMVMMSLRRHSEKSEAKNRFTVHCILTQDSVDTVEQRNFEFRHGNLDVLVINWDSINAVIRGTVDAVILFDSPPARFFQTMMETEMENLISRICVKLKLYILLDQQADRTLLPEYVKFLRKYKRRAPQWFKTLYERYRAEFNAKLEAQTSEIEDTLTGDVNSDVTIR